MDRVIAILGGTGGQGFGLALRWLKAGEHVVIGSRFRRKAEAKAEEARAKIGSSARVEGLPNREAVSKADVIVLTVPFPAQIATIKRVRKAMRRDQILVDVTIPLASTLGGDGWKLLRPWEGSAAEQAASYIPEGVKLVSAFHTVSARLLRNLSRPVDCDVLLCGDDAEAKKVVAELAEKIPGVRALDCGPLANSRLLEAAAALLIAVNRVYGVGEAGLRITGVPWG